ncbi:hypothetical protein CBG31_18355, partial [Vibrio cholerae O139]
MSSHVYKTRSMRLKTTVSTQVDVYSCIHELQQSMDSNGLSNLICYFTEEYDAQLLSSMLKAAFPGIPIIG